MRSLLDTWTRAAVRFSEENLELRKLLWLRHGCSIHLLYGDDGEMQCGVCKIDFKRLPSSEIDARFHEIGVTKYLASLQGDKPQVSPAVDSPPMCRSAFPKTCTNAAPAPCGYCCSCCGHARGICAGFQETNR